MRKLVLLAWLTAALLTFGACADSPTSPDQQTPAQEISSGEGPVLDVQVQGCVVGGICSLPPISSDPSEPPPDCDVWWKPDCGACATGGIISGPEGGMSVQGCPDVPPGGPGGSGTPPPPGGDPGAICPTAAASTCPSEPPPADTCKTGDPIVDDPQVSEGLASLWAQSNPDANLYQRVEKAGWIVEYPAGQFSIMQFTGTERFGCGDYRNVPMPAQGTVVGFVHTHPYAVGENIADCSMRSVQTYDGTPSDVDRKSSVALGNHFGLGRPLPGYIIDKDGYYRYDGQGNTATPRRVRCGY